MKAKSSEEKALPAAGLKTLGDDELTAVCGGNNATPKLYEALHNGTHIPKVVIEL
jgi:type VI protein secretion system component Hcp